MNTIIQIGVASIVFLFLNRVPAKTAYPVYKYLVWAFIAAGIAYPDELGRVLQTSHYHYTEFTNRLQYVIGIEQNQ